MERYEKLKTPPKDALKTIGFGALKGKSDINPQWRYEAMTKVFGLCGVGWYYEIDKTWTEPGTEGQVMVFAQVSVYVKDNGEWSKPIVGVGGNMLKQMGKGMLKENDEAYKMAVTDALGTAMKMIGVAADVYRGNYDGSKYSYYDSQAQSAQPKSQPAQPKSQPVLQAQPAQPKNQTAPPQQASKDELKAKLKKLAESGVFTAEDIKMYQGRLKNEDWSVVLSDMEEAKKLKESK